MQEKQRSWSESFPHRMLFNMAFLDALQFSGLIVTAAGVTPTMTVILLHANTPFVVAGSSYVFDGRQYSPSQYRGVLVISCAVLCCLVRPIIRWCYLDDVSLVSSSFLYVLFTAVQGYAMLYKEKCIINFGQPLDVHTLSFWLFLYQLLVTVLLSPLIYLFQGIVVEFCENYLFMFFIFSSSSIVAVASDWTGFPIDRFFSDVSGGFRCLMGKTPEGDPGYDTEYSICEGSVYLILSYVICTIVSLFSVEKVLQLGNQILGRALFIGVFFAIITLAIYDKSQDNGYGFYGSNIGILDIVAFFCLLWGMETYYHDPEPDGQALTSYIPQK